MRRRACVDENQPEVIKALRAVGASVQPLHAVGQGVPDLLVGWNLRNYLVEVKDGTRPPSERKLTLAQEKWHREWRGQVLVVKSLDEALAIVGLRVSER